MQTKFDSAGQVRLEMLNLECREGEYLELYCTTTKRVLFIPNSAPLTAKNRFLGSARIIHDRPR